MNLILLRRVMAEAVGTYAIITAGCGAIMVNQLSGDLGHVGIALSFGLIVLAMIAALGHISGAHFNPAVTIAFALTRHFPRREVLPYIVAQVAGAILGALTLRLAIGDVASLGATIPGGSLAQTFAIETLLTAVLMLVIIAVATDTRAQGTPAAVAIGMTVVVEALWGGKLSGASMNPARSLGPALVAGLWAGQWVYWIAPIVGACLGALAYQFLRGEKPK